MSALNAPLWQKLRARAGQRLAPWWPWLKRLGAAAFFGLVAWLLVSEARRIDWPAVWAAARDMPSPVLLLAAMLSVASHLLYACFDLVGRRYTGHNLRTPTVMGVTFVSYVFNLNLGSLVGAVALRYRLYARLGLRYSVVTRVLAMSMISNWLGYVLLAGLLFAVWPPALPPDWLRELRLLGPTLAQNADLGLRTFGAALLAVGMAYLVACAVSSRRRFVLRGHRVRLPGAGMALLQASMGLANWLLIISLLALLMPPGVTWLQVASVLLVAAVAGVLSHVPAGLGVLEAVFIALMGHVVPEPQLLASLLLYRGLYYVLPLGLATLVYLLTEARAPRLASAPAAP